MPFEVSTTRGIERAADRAEFGDRHLKVGQEFEQERLELLVGAIDFVDQQHRRALAPDRGEQRALEQIVFREDLRLDRVDAGAGAFARLDGEQLALIVPFIERRIGVEALVALHADELAAVHVGERLGDLGLADARLALDQQRALQMIHHPQRGRKIAVGDIAGLGEVGGDGFARESSASFQRRRRASFRRAARASPPTCHTR